MDHGTVAAYGRKCRCVPCKGANAEYQRQWRNKNSEKNKSYKREWQKARRSRLRSEILSLLGSKCSTCGDGNQLEIDHVYGGGSEHRQLIKKRSYLVYVRDIRDQVAGGSTLFQLLCAPCHKNKTRETS